MTKRDPHADNELIEAMQEEAGGSTMQNDRSGGNLARDIGTRAEQKAIEGNLDGDETDRVRGSDKPESDRQMGQETLDAIRQGRQS